MEKPALAGGLFLCRAPPSPPYPTDPGSGRHDGARPPLRGQSLSGRPFPPLSPSDACTGLCDGSSARQGTMDTREDAEGPRLAPSGLWTTASRRLMRARICSPCRPLSCNIAGRHPAGHRAQTYGPGLRSGRWPTVLGMDKRRRTPAIRQAAENAARAPLGRPAKRSYRLAGDISSGSRRRPQSRPRAGAGSCPCGRDRR
ncbi:hypothetical protein GGD81_002334 [Rhodobium orientis]|nr:hypothetical protein [Rhodobium orientis]